MMDESGEYDGDIGSFFHYFTEVEDMTGVRPLPISNIRELTDRSEQYYKEKSYRMQSTISQEEVKMPNLTERTLRMMKMNWMKRMMMRDLLIWEMMRMRGLPRRSQRLVRRF